mmetsp:Transcript_40696/g.81523  ORF Transcript_40696/g.81523 Transcript_40696/m.81523 type:complete len:118 (-) Transcript_40696:484-837(-)
MCSSSVHFLSLGIAEDGDGGERSRCVLFPALLLALVMKLSDTETEFEEDVHATLSCSADCSLEDGCKSSIACDGFADSNPGKAGVLCSGEFVSLEPRWCSSMLTSNNKFSRESASFC